MLNFKNLELVFWALVPASITLLLLIFCIIPKHLWGISYIMPLLPLIPVFYWGRAHTSEIPYWFAFIIGISSDALSGTPLGLSALLYLLFLFILHAQGKYLHKEGFIIIWGYFIILLATTSMLGWVFMSFTGNQFHAALPAFLQWLLTSACYPIFHKLFDMVAEHIKQRRWILLHV
jgi:rod shape-determining protein MreD